MLKGKIALVTGASGGIGCAAAKALAAAGAKLVLVGRSESRLSKLVQFLRDAGADALAVQADISVEADVERAFARALATFSRLDLLINNAGIFDTSPLPALTLEAWEEVMAVNLRGPFLCTRAAFTIMQRQPLGGRIINIGSLSAKRVRANSAAYSASKFGLAGLTEVTALEGRPFGISCGILHPGNVAVEAKRHITEPMMPPDVIADTIVAMASLPRDINVLESVILPVGQTFIGRG